MVVLFQEKKVRGFLSLLLLGSLCLFGCSEGSSTTPANGAAEVTFYSQTAAGTQLHHIEGNYQAQ
jgi:ABC-type glycerol-3-phosphate transport system substrate-binding protein